MARTRWPPPRTKSAGPLELCVDAQVLVRVRRGVRQVQAGRSAVLSPGDHDQADEHQGQRRPAGQAERAEDQLGHEDQQLERDPEAHQQDDPEQDGALGLQSAQHLHVPSIPARTAEQGDAEECCSWG